MEIVSSFGLLERGGRLFTWTQYPRLVIPETNAILNAVHGNNSFFFVRTWALVSRSKC